MTSHRTTALWIAIALGGCNASSAPQEQPDANKPDATIEPATDGASMDAPLPWTDSALADRDAMSDSGADSALSPAGTCVREDGLVVPVNAAWTVGCAAFRCTREGIVMTRSCSEAGVAIDSAAPAPDVVEDGLYRHCIAPDNARIRPLLNYASADGSGCTCSPPLNMDCNHRSSDRRCRMPGGSTVAVGERWTSPDRCITCDCFAHDPYVVGFRCETAARCNAFARPGCYTTLGEFVAGGSPSPTQSCTWCWCDPGGHCNREYGPSCPP